VEVLEFFFFIYRQTANECLSVDTRHSRSAAAGLSGPLLRLTLCTGGDGPGGIFKADAERGTRRRGGGGGGWWQVGEDFIDTK
jgi:hypothetical protein